MTNNKAKFGKILLIIAAVILFVTFAVMFFVRDASFKDDSGTVDVILFSGQSNMAGYGEIASEYDINKGDAYEYLNESNKLIDIEDPVGERTGRDANKAFKGSMIPSFVYHYLKKSDHKVIAVPSAYGATSVNNWQPEGEYLQKTITKYNNAISYIEKNSGYDVGNKIYVWLQGETDILIGTSKDEYKEKFLNMNEELMNSTGISECILIPIGSRRDAPIENAEIINKAQYELIDENGSIVLGSENAFEFSLDKTMLKKDVLHFNTKALELLGKESVENYFSGKN